MPDRLRGNGVRASILVGAATIAAITGAATARPETARPGHRTEVPAFSLPDSDFASPAAKALAQRQRDTEPLPPDAPIAVAQTYYDRQNSDRVRRMRAMYDVKIVETRIGGVSVQQVTPAGGVAPENRHRVLINLHGGAFLWGAGSGALAEAIPIAAVGRLEVVTVDYRQGPDHHFPAASQDVAAVYQALLADHAAKAIGIYGCSAGGVLTAQSVAWILVHHLPAPGAIGTFCGSLVDFGGDSAYFAAAAEGRKPDDRFLRIFDLPYFKGARADDPLVFPGSSRLLLARFPPTLLISGTRDFAMSSVVHSNELLRDAGVRTELRIWEGMPHAFFVDPETNEARQAYRAIAAFFERNLSNARRVTKGRPPG